MRAVEVKDNIKGWSLWDYEGYALSKAEAEVIVKALEQEPKWIPVSEGLPEDHENVLIFLSSNQITIGLYNSHKLPFMDKSIGWGADAPHNWSSDDVIAWMPVPEPYKANEEMMEND